MPARFALWTRRRARPDDVNHCIRGEVTTNGPGVEQSASSAAKGETRMDRDNNNAFGWSPAPFAIRQTISLRKGVDAPLRLRPAVARKI